jgi:hypothetical protein
MMQLRRHQHKRFGLVADTNSGAGPSQNDFSMIPANGTRYPDFALPFPEWTAKTAIFT